MFHIQLLHLADSSALGLTVNHSRAFFPLLQHSLISTICPLLLEVDFFFITKSVFNIFILLYLQML